MNPAGTSTYTLPIEEVVQRIVTLNEGLRDFWSSSHGWAPAEAADLLGRSRLDWQVSLSKSLSRWVDEPRIDDQAAVQILGYANVGTLVEGTLKVFLGVYIKDYQRSAKKIMSYRREQDPDGAALGALRRFFKNSIWRSDPSDDWDPWIQRIQNRRNAIHAFQDRDIGVHADLIDDIRRYLIFLRRINGQLPYPDDGEGPIESYDQTFREYDWETDAPSI